MTSKLITISEAPFTPLQAEEIGLPFGSVVKSPANAGDMGSVTYLRKSHMLQSN